MFGAIAGGIASALAGGAMSKLFGGGQKAASGGIQGDVLATDNNTVGMGDAGIKSAIQGSNVPNPDEAVPDRKSGSAGMPRPISYAVFCLKKKTLLHDYPVFKCSYGTHSFLKHTLSCYLCTAILHT